MNNNEINKTRQSCKTVELTLQNICNYCIIAKIAEIEGLH